jgi:hypothetical protein
MVPLTATPMPVAASWAVSTSAEPMEVRSSGSPLSTLVPAMTPLTRMPAATSISDTPIHAYPRLLSSP